MSTDRSSVPGMAKMREGLQEYLGSLAEDGDVVTPTNAVLIYETQGIEPSGDTFWQHSYCAIATTGHRTAVYGLLEIVVPQIKHDLVCAGECKP